MRQGFRVRAAVALHVTRGDQRVDDRFFGALHGGAEQRIEWSLPIDADCAIVAPCSAAAFAVENAMKMSPEPLPAMLPMRREAERGTARDALAADAAAAARRYRSR